MSVKGYRGTPRSNDEWIAALLADGSEQQRAAFGDLGRYLRYRIVNDIYRRANSLPALASLAQVEIEAVADEIVQLAFIRIYDHLHTFVDRGQFLNFALIVARRILIDEFRKKQWTTGQLSPLVQSADEQGHTSRLPSLDDLPDLRQTLNTTSAIWFEMVQIVYDAIREDLSESQAQAFIAYEFRNLSSKEIAPLLGRSPASIDQLRHQAKLKIKSRLLAQGYDEKDLTLS